MVRSVDTWIERIRIVRLSLLPAFSLLIPILSPSQWLAANVVKPLVAQMEDLERTHNLSLALPLLPTQSTTTYSTASSNSPWYSIAPPQYSAMLADLTKQAPQSEAWQTRVRVEAYMQVLGSTSREYLVQRIKGKHKARSTSLFTFNSLVYSLLALGEGDLLARFKWNGGGPWKDREWTAELPTDSQILIHLFCTYMDFVLPRDQQSVDPTKPFTSRYFCLVPDTPGKDDKEKNRVHSTVFLLSRCESQLSRRGYLSAAPSTATF